MTGFNQHSTNGRLERGPSLGLPLADEQLSAERLAVESLYVAVLSSESKVLSRIYNRSLS